MWNSTTHSAAGITADASISGIGDSSDQGEEKSAVKNTAPDKRTTRRTSDSTSIATLAERLGVAAGGTVKDFRAAINSSSKSGVSGKPPSVAVIGLRPRSIDHRVSRRERISRGALMPLMTPDPTFYPSPKMAAQSPPEKLAYLALINPLTDGCADAIGVVDLDPGSSGYGRLVGQTDMPHAGDELHHFGWNACSSCLCPYAAHPHMERRYLIVPGIASSRTHIIDTKPDPTTPTLVKVIEADALAARTRYSP